MKDFQKWAWVAEAEALVEGLQRLSKLSPSRELSLAITNAQQAQHWLGAIEVSG